MIPRIRGPPEGKHLARDESRPTAETITLDAFFKAFKESLEIQNQRFGELTETMDVIDRRFKEQDVTNKMRLESFKNHICEDLEERFEKFRQEIKSGSEEAQITVGG